MTWEDHDITGYKQYFDDPHWEQLKEKLIFSKPLSKCYICKKTVEIWTDYYTEKKKSNLVVHHASYRNLWKERENRDVFVLCHNCHTQVHFWKILWIFKFKIPLKTAWLLFSMRLRLINFYTRNRQFSLMGLWLSCVVIIMFYNLSVFVLGKTTKFTWALSKKILGLVF